MKRWGVGQFLAVANLLRHKQNIYQQRTKGVLLLHFMWGVAEFAKRLDQRVLARSDHVLMFYHPIASTFSSTELPLPSVSEQYFSSSISR